MTSFINAPAWSMAQRSKSTNLKKQNIITPGPGNYNSNVNLGKKTPGWKIGTSNRGNQNGSFGPGPGQYTSIYNKQGPKITMGTKSKTLFNEQNVPGPGNYHINDHSVAKVHSGFTMGARYNPNKDEDIKQPGPGSYDINQNQKSGVKIGTSIRGFGKEKQLIPGPGTYSYNNRPSSAGPQFSFGSGQKSIGGNSRFESIPGPGQYNYENAMSSITTTKGVTIGQKFNKNHNGTSNIPGPGQYQSNIKRPMSGAKIGKAQRALLGNSIGPGPGAYDCSSGGNKKSAIKIGTGKRHNMEKSDTPGPGSYEANLNLNQRSGITISGVKNKKMIEITPGPGAYDSNNQEYALNNRPYSAKIGKANRSKFDSSETPGPGSYNIHRPQNWKFAYTRQNRGHELNSQQPGPGQYEIPLTVPSVPYYELSNPKFHNSGYNKF